MHDIDYMDIGEILDIVTTYLNTVQDDDTVNERNATQEDIDRIWG